MKILGLIAAIILGSFMIWTGLKGEDAKTMPPAPAAEEGTVTPVSE